MSRLQLALNVSNLEESVAFYSKFFNTPPTKLRPGYANFAISEPPLKLVLFENSETPGSINHLGVEVFSTSDVVAATRYLASQGLETDVEDGTVCCHALQNKVWVNGPDGSRWETYTVLADASDSGSVTGEAQCGVDATSSATSCC